MRGGSARHDFEHRLHSPQYTRDGGRVPRRVLLIGPRQDSWIERPCQAGRESATRASRGLPAGYGAVRFPATQ